LPGLLLFVFLFHVATVTAGAVVFLVVLGFHIARIATATAILMIRRVILRVLFHLQVTRIATTAATTIFCFSVTRARLFHRARITVATTRLHRATSLGFLLLVARGGVLGQTGCCRNQ
jgi:hypothetical protein